MHRLTPSPHLRWPLLLTRAGGCYCCCHCLWLHPCLSLHFCLWTPGLHQPLPLLLISPLLRLHRLPCLSRLSCCSAQQIRPQNHCCSCSWLQSRCPWPYPHPLQLRLCPLG